MRGLVGRVYGRFSYGRDMKWQGALYLVADVEAEDREEKHVKEDTQIHGVGVLRQEHDRDVQVKVAPPDRHEKEPCEVKELSAVELAPRNTLVVRGAEFVGPLDHEHNETYKHHHHLQEHMHRV